MGITFYFVLDYGKTRQQGETIRSTKSGDTRKQRQAEYNPFGE